MKQIIKALDLPTSYKVIQSAKGHRPSGKYVEIASLHPGTGGHQIVFATYQDGKWHEVSERFYKDTAEEIFNLPTIR
jgi:hypothetical protein